MITVEADDGHVQIEHHRPPRYVGDHALGPEKRGNPRATRHLGNVMHTGAGIDDHVTRWKLDRVGAVSVLDHQFSSVVLLG